MKNHIDIVKELLKCNNIDINYSGVKCFIYPVYFKIL